MAFPLNAGPSTLDCQCVGIAEADLGLSFSTFDKRYRRNRREAVQCNG